MIKKWIKLYDKADVWTGCGQLFERVENKHGWMLVSHALSYITASKNGVSEPEIEDFISLDDKENKYTISICIQTQEDSLFW